MRLPFLKSTFSTAPAQKYPIGAQLYLRGSLFIQAPHVWVTIVDAKLNNAGKKWEYKVLYKNEKTKQTSILSKDNGSCWYDEKDFDGWLGFRKHKGQDFKLEDQVIALGKDG